jgi:hypothetical protein
MALRHNPLHRIERWVGTHFRAAALWEVGVFILVRHRTGPVLCESLEWQKGLLDNIQRGKDILDQDTIEMQHEEHSSTEEDAFEAEAESDAAFMEELDRLYFKRFAGGEGSNPEDVIRDGREDAEEEEFNTPEADVVDGDAGRAGFATYITPGSGRSAASESETPAAPGADALNNQYVRIIHTNGVHHIALVSCNCHGHTELPLNLMYARLVPTSFSRIRTLFTADLLDQFRYANLEMKASAWQFFQMLRRTTRPMAPSTVVNFYHELRRMSRLWRWMKRLKWAGYGHKAADPMRPVPGELVPFCPACPQDGINIPTNWRNDPQRYLLCNYQSYALTSPYNS